MMMHGLREYAGALATSLVSAMARPRHLILIGAGFMIAAATLLVMLALPAGLDHLAGHTGHDDIVVVLPRHSIDEGGHAFSAHQIQVLKTLPGVAHDAEGHPLIAPQFVAYAKLRRADGQPGTVLLRGVTPAFYRVIGASVHVVRGHRPRAGHNEFMAGAGAAAAYVALGLGDHNTIHDQPMVSAGVFNAGASFWNSEIWMSQDVLQSLYRSPSAITSAWVELASPNAYSRFMHALHANKSLVGVRAARQSAFYAAQTGFLGHFIHIATTSVAIVLGLGAILAITNALGIALDARRHELAIMRATGYRQVPLTFALLTEVWLLGVLCVALVAIPGFAFWNGHAIDSATLLHSVRFKADISFKVILTTLAYTLLLGTISALVPVRRIMRAPLVDALRNP